MTFESQYQSIQALPEISSTVLPHNSSSEILFLYDNLTIVVSYQDGHVMLADIDTGALRRELTLTAVDSRESSRWVSSVALSYDGKWLGASSHQRNVHVWNTENLDDFFVLSDGMSNMIITVNWTQQGDKLICGGWDNAAFVWNVITRKMLYHLPTETPVFSAVFSPDAQLIGLGTRGGVSMLWQANNQKLIHQRGYTGQVEEVMFSPDGRYLITAVGSYVYFTDVRTFEDVHTLSFSDDVGCIIFTPANEYFVVTTDDGQIGFWSYPDMQQILPTTSTSDPITYVNFTPDGQKMGLLRRRGNVDLYDVTALKLKPRQSVTDDTPIDSGLKINIGDISRPLAIQQHTFGWSHIDPAHAQPVAAASWLRGAAALGLALPYVLAHDLGIILTRPDARVMRPEHIPKDADTGAYEDFLRRLQQMPLVRTVQGWDVRADNVIAVLVAKVVEDAGLADPYRIPTGAQGAALVSRLARVMADQSAATTWDSTPSESRPTLRDLFPDECFGRMEKRVAAFDRDELRYLVMYGPTVGNPADLLDLMNLTQLPAEARMALQQVIKLMPRVVQTRSLRSAQTYPEGGYESLDRKGSLDSLLASELAHDEDMFLHRLLNHEALYYGRERPRERRGALAYIVAQTGYGVMGDIDVLSRAMVLALARAMSARGYDVRYSFAGRTLTEPAPIVTPHDMTRVLYHRERTLADPAAVTREVLAQLRGWREAYHTREVLWVLTDTFDTHQRAAESYRALRNKCGQQAWFVRIADDLPPLAKHFHYTHTLPTSVLWQDRTPPQPLALGNVQIPEDTRRKSEILLPAPFEWVKIPAGKVTLGEGTDPFVKAHGVGQTFDVATFEMAKYPVTNAQYALFVQAGGYDDRQWWTDAGWARREIDGWTEPSYWQDEKWNGADYPVVGVSWYEALAFCRWLSVQTGENITLPTEQQWQRAAQGDDERVYPWGDEFDATRCNTSESKIRRTTPVTQYGDMGASPFGVVDMAGNIWELILTEYETGLANIYSISRRTLHGGSWTSNANNARSVYRPYSDPLNRFNFYGFRLARVPRAET